MGSFVKISVPFNVHLIIRCRIPSTTKRSSSFREQPRPFEGLYRDIGGYVGSYGLERIWLQLLALFNLRGSSISY